MLKIYTAYLKRNNVARFRKHCCNVNCIVVDRHVAVNNTKLLNFGTGIQLWVLFALLSKLKYIFFNVHGTVHLSI